MNKVGLDISAHLSFDLLRWPLNPAFALLNTCMLDLKVAQLGPAQPGSARKEKESPHRDDGIVMSYQASPRLILKPQCMECIIVRGEERRIINGLITS